MSFDATSLEPQRRTRWDHGWLLILLTAFAYGSSLRAGTIWDDDTWVTQNDVLFAPGGLGRIWRGDTLQYYPVFYMSFWLECRLFGMNLAAFHATNVLLHACNAVLAWRVFRRLAVPGAWLAAAVFAVHPVHVESVTWISERKNVLSCFFCLAALLAYLRHMDYGRWRWYVAAFVLYLLALLSKTVTSALPLILLILCWYQRRPVRRADWLKFAPLLMLGGLMGRATTWYEAQRAGASGAAFDWSLAERSLIAGRALWFYVGKLLWPAGLCGLYPRWEIAPADVLQWLWPASAVATAAVLWMLRGRLGRAPAAAVAGYFVLIFPALGFFNIYLMNYTFAADHWQYHASLALIPLFIGIPIHAFRCTAGGQRRLMPVRVAACVLLLATLTLMTRDRVGVFSSSLNLWTDAARKNPRSATVHNNLGSAHFSAGRIDLAEHHFEEAARLEPRDAGTAYNLGMVAQARGQTQTAERSYREAIVYDPRHYPAHVNLCALLIQRGETKEALEHGRRGVELAPRLPEARFAYARALQAPGRRAAAIRQYEEGLKLAPSLAPARLELATLLQSEERYAEAVTVLEYPQADPASRAELHNALAVVLATCPRPDLRDSARAVRLAENVVRITGGNNPRFIDTLARAYHAAGRVDEAVTVARRALALARAAGPAALVTEIEQRLTQWSAPIATTRPIE